MSYLPIDVLRHQNADPDLSVERSQLLFFDIETTGLHPEKGAKLVEIACVSRNEILHNWRISHLKANDALLRKILPLLVQDLTKGVVVGHNVSFDLNFIAYKADKLGLPGLDVSFIDTLALARRVVHGLASYKLGHLLRHFDIRVHGELHTAIVDAQVTRALFWKLMEAGGFSTLKEAGIKRLKWSLF